MPKDSKTASSDPLTLQLQVAVGFHVGVRSSARTDASNCGAIPPAPNLHATVFIVLFMEVTYAENGWVSTKVPGTLLFPDTFSGRFRKLLEFSPSHQRHFTQKSSG